MGFGFVEFQSTQTAMKALKKMDGVKLQGHLLQISVAKGTSNLVFSVLRTIHFTLYICVHLFTIQPV
jgi:RNA recognition motif-containing protein